MNQSLYVITVCNLGGYFLLWVPIVKSNQEKSLPNTHDKCLKNRHSVIRVDTATETDAVFSNLMAGGITGICMYVKHYYIAVSCIISRFKCTINVQGKLCPVAWDKWTLQLG